MRKVTVPEIKAAKINGNKFCLVTCYDYTSATIVEKSDVEMILIGDSLGMTMLGYEGTIGVTADDIIHHGKAVRRGAPTTFIIGDMPFGYYNESIEQGVHTANRLMMEINCDAVKLEGGKRSAPVIKAITEAGIPVCGHIGLTPQSSSAMGGFKVQGKSIETVNELLDDAKAVEKAGAFMLMVEGVPTQACQYIRNNIDIPIIAIGAGDQCEFQALVFHDMMGFNDWVPKFAKKYAEVGKDMLKALNTFHNDVKEKAFPTPEYSYNTKIKGL